MLPDGKAVREAVLGWQGGIASALKPGSVILDMSSAEPVGTQKLAPTSAPAGVRVVDAPVSGGIARAETGTLSLMVGGHDEEAFERCSRCSRCSASGSSAPGRSAPATR